MNGTSGFHEMRSSTSRSSTNRMLREQRHRFETILDIIFFSSSKVQKQ